MACRPPRDGLTPAAGTLDGLPPVGLGPTGTPAGFTRDGRPPVVCADVVGRMSRDASDVSAHL